MTVATGVVTATVLFSSELGTTARYFAYGSWVFFFVSVFFGIAVLFNISGSINEASKTTRRPADRLNFSACAALSLRL